MQRPFFHKLILSSTIQNRQLRIPENFIKKYRDGLSSYAMLTVPDGHIWRIGLKKADNKIWFHDSWQEFMERYSIRVGYFLVFRYDGNSAFSVYIYNLSTSEINYQFNTLSSTGVSNHRKQYSIFEEMEDDDSVEIFDCASPFQTLDSFSNSPNTPALQNLFNGSKFQNCMNMDRKDNVHSSLAANHLRAGSCDTGVQFNRGSADEVSLALKKQNKQSINNTMRKRKKTDPNSQEQSASGEEEADTRLRFYETASARKRTVTAEERERALNAAKTFEPPNPFCRVVLRPSYLYRGCIMYLPSGFAEKNLNGVSGFIKLQLSNGRQWPVRCLFKGGRAKLSQGWYEFTLENNLEEGDVCVFELLNTKDIVLQVTAFRVLEDSRLMNQHMQQHVSQTK